MENALSRAGRGAQTTRVLVKKAIFAAIYFAAALILEVAAFYSAEIGLLPEYFLLDLSVLLMVTLGVFIVPGFVAQIVVIGVLLFFEMVLCVVDSILIGQSTMVFCFSMLNIIGEAGNVFNPRMLLGSLGLVIFALLFYGGVLTGCIFLQKKMKTVPCFEWQTALLLVFTVVISASASFGLYSASLFSFRRADVQDSLYKYEDDMYLYETQPQDRSAIAFKKFGFFGFYSKNFFNWLGSGGDEITREERDEQLAELDDYFEEGEWNSALPANGYMAGRYRGKNVVLIVIESGEWYGINKDYTPTLYAMAKNGWRMSEYYARDKTNHSEALSVLGSYPAQLRNSIIPSGANGEGLLEHDFSFTLPHIMQSAGYTTNYFHANDSGFYSRGETHGDLYGFENTHFLEDMSRLEGYYDKTWFYDFDRDSEMISQYLGAFTDGGENGRFYTMMLSLISHGHYDDLRGGDYPGEMTEEEKQQFSESCTVQNLETYYEYIDGYPTQYVDERFAVPHGERDEEGELTQEYLMFKRYQAGLMDLDVGVNRLVHYLEQTGELDNTLFVFYADHNRYYDEQSYYFKQVADGVYYDTSLYNIPFFIWDGGRVLLFPLPQRLLRRRGDKALQLARRAAHPLRPARLRLQHQPLPGQQRLPRPRHHLRQPRIGHLYPRHLLRRRNFIPRRRRRGRRVYLVRRPAHPLSQRAARFRAGRRARHLYGRAHRRGRRPRICRRKRLYLHPLCRRLAVFFRRLQRLRRRAPPLRRKAGNAGRHVPLRLFRLPRHRRPRARKRIDLFTLFLSS